jgi:hypothetical protein
LKRPVIKETVAVKKMAFEIESFSEIERAILIDVVEPEGVLEKVEKAGVPETEWAKTEA